MQTPQPPLGMPMLGRPPGRRPDTLPLFGRPPGQSPGPWLLSGYLPAFLALDPLHPPYVDFWIAFGPSGFRLLKSLSCVVTCLVPCLVIVLPGSRPALSLC